MQNLNTSATTSSTPVNSSRYVGVGMMLGAALAFTLLGGLIKALDPRFRVWDVAFYRLFSNALIILFFFRPWSQLGRVFLPSLLMARGVVGSIAFLLMVAALQRLPLSMAMVLFYTFPAFAALFSVLLFKSRLTWLSLFWLGLTFVGVVVILELRVEGDWMGMVIAVVGGVLAGLTVAIIKELRYETGSVPIYFSLCAVGAVITMGPFLMSPQVPTTATDWMLMSGIVITSFVGQMLMTHGFKFCQSWEGGMLLSTEVILAVVIGVFFFGDQLTLRFGIGSLFIFISVLAMQIGLKPQIPRTGV